MTKHWGKLCDLTTNSERLTGPFVGTPLNTGGALLLSSRHTLETVSSQMKPKYYWENVPRS